MGPNAAEHAWRAEEFGFHATPDERMDAHEAYLTGYRAALAASPSEEKSPEWLAKTFHDAYELLAPRFGYKTREASAVPWEQVPEDNRRLMIATCEIALAALRTTKEGEDE